MRDPIDDESLDQFVSSIVAARRAQILERYEEQLTELIEGGSIQDGPIRDASIQDGRWAIPDRLLDEAAAVLDDLHRRLAHGGDPPADPGPATGESPVADSRRASGVLFRTALHTVAAELPEEPGAARSLVSVAAAAHESIVYRLTTTAGGYAGYLLDRLHQSHVDERRRVARELHDLIAHAVAVVLQDLEMFALHRQQDAARAEAKLEAAMANLRDTLDMLRAITQDLRRSAAESGLTAALRSYLDTASVAAATDLRVIGDDARVSPAVRGELFLVLREALRNAHLHAAATAVRAEVEIETDAVRAVVSDDGRGFDPAAPAGQPAGTGLVSMRERVALLGGTMEVRSTPGRGTSISVRVPLMRA